MNLPLRDCDGSTWSVGGTWKRPSVTMSMSAIPGRPPSIRSPIGQRPKDWSLFQSQRSDCPQGSINKIRAGNKCNHKNKKMKNNKIQRAMGWFTASLLLVALGCSPIEDRDHLVNTTDVAGVELIATQSTPGGNKIELRMATPGITGYWDYNLGNAYSDRVEFIYPIPGTATFTFVGTLGGEFFSKTIDVQVDQLDNALDPDWYDLVSAQTDAGKTWVFNGGPGADGGMWWYMSPPNDPAAWQTAWWNAAGDCCPPV